MGRSLSLKRGSKRGGPLGHRQVEEGEEDGGEHVPHPELFPAQAQHIEADAHDEGPPTALISVMAAVLSRGAAEKATPRPRAEAKETAMTPSMTLLETRMPYRPRMPASMAPIMALGPRRRGPRR